MLSLRFFSLLVALLGFFTFATQAHPSELQPKRLDRVSTRAYTYKQATRSRVVSRAERPARVVAAAKRAPSPVPFPVSTCPGYDSTGTVPWAVYDGVDIDGGATLFDNISTRSACNDLCEASDGCIATTYSEQYDQCYIVYTFQRYKPPTPYLVTMRNVDCATNAPNVPASYASTYGATCCVQYRAT